MSHEFLHVVRVVSTSSEGRKAQAVVELHTPAGVKRTTAHLRLRADGQWVDSNGRVAHANAA